MTGRSWIYLVAAIVLGALTYRGATLVDQGVTRTWSEWARFLWAVGLVLSTSIAVGAGVGAFFARDDERLGSLIFRIVLLFGLGMSGVIVLGHILEATTGFAEGRTFLMSFGIFIAICTWRKPWWFWNHAKAKFLRDLIGDAATTLVYYGVSVASIGYGIWGSNPHL